jgi:hypothetical protein
MSSLLKTEICRHAVQVGRECRNRGGQTKGKVLNDEAHVKMFIFMFTRFDYCQKEVKNSLLRNTGFG